ncbi:MAG: NUDIX domain-containing protein [Phycisphaerales bacterium]
MSEPPASHGPPGVRLRADIVDVYLFRVDGAGRPEFLQLRRTKRPMRGAWHPVMGHIRSGETAIRCAVREVREEVGLDACSPDAVGLWQLEQVHPFFLAESDEIILSPRLALRVSAGWTPTLNDEHDGARWTPLAEVNRAFCWPGQRECCREIATEIVDRNAYTPLEI